MNPKQYTQKEIDSKINILTTQYDILISQRKDINIKVRHKRENIKYYKELSVNQTKLF